MSEWLFVGHALIEARMKKDIWINISDGKISSVYQQNINWIPEVGSILCKYPEGFLLPGLIDTHVHLVHMGLPDESWELDPVTMAPGALSLRALFNAQKSLSHGVITVRDLGSRDLADICVRNAINEGKFIGSRIIAAGHPITTTAGHMDSSRYIRPGIPYESIAYMGIIADTPGEAQKAVRRCLLEGSDVIKINVSISEPVRKLYGLYAPEMTKEMLDAICELAHLNIRRVTGHSHGGIAIDNAIEAGIDSLEHGRFLTDIQMEKMAEKSIYLTPTLSPDARPPLESKKRKPTDVEWTRKARNVMYDAVKRADAIGVKITAGSDAGMAFVEHGQTAYEIEEISKAGLSSIKSILAATTYAAENLGISDTTGSIKAGLYADLLILNKNPLNDVTVLKDKENFDLIMKEGQRIQ